MDASGPVVRVMRNVALDPGKWKMGLAVFEDGRLTAASPIYVPRSPAV